MPLGTKATVTVENHDGSGGAACHFKLFSDGKEILNLDVSPGDTATKDFANPTRGDVEYSIHNANILYNAVCTIRFYGL